MKDQLESLQAHMAIPYGGNLVTSVSPELADAFKAGDHLVVVQDTGALLHIPAADAALAARAVDDATAAFRRMGSVDERSVSNFFVTFAKRLADDEAFAPIAAANAADVESAIRRARGTTRLELTDKMRADMISGLNSWASFGATRNSLEESISHQGWRVDQIRAGLGVVGFIFEGRPNVFADAAGVLRSGNTVVLRIGSDALGTAKAIVENALGPALDDAGLPAGAVNLLASPSRATGWALFSDKRLSLAVARGSGQAVAQLGSVARQAGVPVSLHGTGGAWIVAASDADPRRFGAAVLNSLDRKVCNTLNTCCIVEERADELVPVFLEALKRAGNRRHSNSKLHVIADQAHIIPDAWKQRVKIDRPGGPEAEDQTSPLRWEDLGLEWEWENSPEVSLAIVPSVDRAVELFNSLSPRFAASLISQDESLQQTFFEQIDAPFVGDGFTRWVDGQYALNKPELGLSNWESGRLLARGAVLSGDSVYTLRSRAFQDDPGLAR